MVKFIRTDLDFILQQIKFAEQHAAGADLRSLFPNPEVPWGLRTISGAFNNLVPGQDQFGAADNIFPRMLTPQWRLGEAGTNYNSPGMVIDSQPRTISNLISDQTANNPAAVAANGGAAPVVSPGLDGIFGTTDDREVFFIPNVAPDEGLSASFNTWMTFFGQFFDHGLDLVTKGGNSIILMPLNDDDPLVAGADGVFGNADDLPADQRFMVVTRATQFGAPGLNENTTSPFVDQNQTYSSHPSHQVFLREYVLIGGVPQSTGKLITGANGGMATWAEVKAQARDLLGIDLTDANVFDVPLIITDQYGNFVPSGGFPQIMLQGGGVAVGNLATPADLTNAISTNHQFLIDIAHDANPSAAPGLVRHEDGTPGGPRPVGTYDGDLLDAHFMAGDGRVNENIGLTAVHAIFHAEHNRLVQHVKDQVLATNDPAFIAEWLVAGANQGDGIQANEWNGQRLFQAAKFGTEMQYQHLVFEEFARTIQPNVNAFLDFNDTIDPSIMAEFAHTVYRFGHSMLTETIDRFDPTFQNSEIGLIAAFLNPLEFVASGPTPEQATAAIIRGLTRQVGNEIDEFVTEALRNNLVGLPLDLPAINLARGRDAGIPSLNEARRQFFAGTGDNQLKPYVSWVDFAQNMKNPASLINFIAAYGTHTSITSAVTLVDKRAAATLLVLGGVGEPADRLDYLNGQGTWLNVETGLNLVDLWIGGLAEAKMPFGGMLGSTFNFVFETQLEALQDGDRLYYLHRLTGLNFFAELENNSFSDIIMRNLPEVKHLPALVFLTPGFTLEVDQSQQFTGLGLDGRDDPTDPAADPLLPLVIRDNPATAGADTNYLRYTGEDHVVLGGSAGNDILISSIGDDTVYGDGGNDRLEGGHGNDDIQGGAGDDIITDVGGDDVLKGGDGNDAIHGGQGLNLLIAGRGNDFIVTGEDSSEVFAGEGNDFILGSKLNIQMMGAEGDDWIEIGTQDGAPGDNFDPFGADEIIGNDVFLGDGGFDEIIGEGGDDITVGSGGPDKIKGMSGFDWVTYKNDIYGVNVEMFGDAFNEAPVPASSAAVMNRYRDVEGMSGSAFADIIRGDDVDTAIILTAGLQGSVLTNIALVAGLQALLDSMLGAGQTSFGAGNILLGGAGGDWIEGRGGDDLIDGDSWLNVRISVRANINGTGAEINSFDSMSGKSLLATDTTGKTLLEYVFDGTYNPGQLTIAREIIDDNDGYDTAVFSGLAAEYAITDLGNGVLRVVDNVVGRDGSDTLKSVERLQFSDVTVPINPGGNAQPVGAPTITDTNGGALETGDVLTASVAGVTDADNPGAITSGVAFYWQVELIAGTNQFTDIINADAFLAVSSRTFTVTEDLAGLRIRVRAIYQDGQGVIEAVTSAPTAVIAAGPPPAPPEPLPDMTASADSAGIRYIRSDLQFIIDQIRIAELNAAGQDIRELIPSTREAFGLRTIDGSFNNLQVGQTEFGAADNIFPRLADAQWLSGPGFNYNSTGMVVDGSPRTISNLIVDQTANNPAAVEANGGAASVFSPGLDGIFGTTDDREVFFIPNVSPDEGLSASFNSWMTFFGQFFDHGLDLVRKGGNSIVFIPLAADDPLVAGADGVFGNEDDLAPGLRFMVVTRATQFGAPGLNENTTSPFVDQNQTYSSHPSHQVFLREYAMGTDGKPHATGKLIVNRDLGLDGEFGTADDVILGGMATWKVVKAQARDMLGIDLTDQDVFNVPLLATDAYGNFIPGANGFVQVVMPGNVLVEGDPNAPVSLVGSVRTGHGFLDDIAHAANPLGDHDGNPGTPNQFLIADADDVAGGGPPALGEYDDELLDAHYIAGDGRVNENIGLTTVHHIFHAEHNRLVEHTKAVALATGDLDFLSQLLMPGSTPAVFPTTPAQIDALVWNGERLFQAAKFGTEMQYQHLVFEEFARTIQPNIDIFVGPTQAYDVTIDPSIVAEFAHTVYRFGHSMLTETIDRFDPTFQNSEIGLIAAFLNPLAFAASGPTPEQAAGAIVRGVTRQAGNEIDEFVTEALRNNLVGLPLDLPAINIARGRDTGIPTLNSARKQFYAMTGDSQLRPYSSWADFVGYMKHPASLINFIAAYGTHVSITSASTLVGKRDAATLLVLGGAGEPADRLDFLNSTGTWAAVETGLNLIDLWIGGLAEAKTPFGGMLGSTFNFVFETQLEALQNGDRFYYLDRLAGLNLLAEMENNSFAKLVMNHTDAKHLPGLVFQTPAYTLEVDQSQQFTGLGLDGRDDPTDPGGDPLLPLVIRDDPNTVGPDTNYLEYTGGDHVVLGGTDGDDTLIASIGDDTLWGDGGNDRIEGGHGNDLIRAGAGDDIITDIGGDDNIQGDTGNDVIQAGNGLNLILGGFGNDFIITGEDSNESFGGVGDDFILGSIADEQNMGGEGNDWIESGSSDGSPGDNFDPDGQDLIAGHDVYIGDGTPNIMNAEGGDDIMIGSTGPGDKYLGASGYDWASFKDDLFGVQIDLRLRAFDAAPIPPSAANVAARFDSVEGLAGSRFSDILTGDDLDALTLPGSGAQGSVLTAISMIDGLQALLNTAFDTTVTSFGSGNIILGGDGSDLITGNGGDDVIDGDRWLNVRISVRANPDGTGAEIASFDSMRSMVPLMLDRTYNPGQLVIVREILDLPALDRPDFDTAIFRGLRADYTVAIDNNGTALDFSDDVVTVTDSVVGRDGVDRVMRVERLQFSDQAQVLVPGINLTPTGLLAISDATPDEDQLLTVTLGTVADGNGIASAFAYFWQVELDPGSGVFEDILRLAGGEETRVTGPTFTPGDAEVGLRLRVRGVYQDGIGVLEEVFSAPTAAVGNVNDAPVGLPALSDATPTQDIAVTALLGGITDADGLTNPNFTFQWQRSNDGTIFADIGGATAPSYSPVAADVNQFLRVVVQYTDDGGTLETVTSPASLTRTGQHFIGNAAGNTFNGTAFDDWMQGFGGNDNLNGNGGSDLLDGGLGNDTLNGGDGDDFLNGEGGNDTLNGGAGNDTMNGGANNDTYIVEDAGDVVVEAAVGGTDVVQTTLAAYTLTAEVENLTFTGAGNFAGTGNGLANTIAGAGGDDTLSGLGGADTLQGNGGADTLIGGAGGDNLQGGAGNDVLRGGADNDTLNGAAGSDTASYVDETDAMFINLQAGNTRRGSAAAAIEDTLTAVENAAGGAGADNITGSTGANVISGNGGDDTINYAIGGGADTVDGGLGTDTLAITGGAGADTLDLLFNGASITSVEGGAVSNLEAITANLAGGNDTLSYAGSTAAVNVNLATSTASGLASILNIENATGGNGDDTLTSGAGAQTLNGGGGADTLDGGAGNDTLTGGAGNDTFVANNGDTINEAAGGGTDIVFTDSATFTLAGQVENLTFTGAGAFTGNGNGQDNVITGGNGGNTLNGNGGADTLIGGAGVDGLNGGGGNDRLTGGIGNDVMDGGGGVDTFVLTPGFGVDIIGDFDANPNPTQDFIDVSALGITAATFAASVTITDLGANTLLTFAGGDTVTLMGVNGVGANVITAADFIFAP